MSCPYQVVKEFDDVHSFSLHTRVHVTDRRMDGFDITILRSACISISLKETQLSLTNRATHLCKCYGWPWLTS